MAFSRRFLGCFLCGDKKDVNDLPPATPVEFAIEGKNPQKSDDSFDSEPESTKDEEKTPLTVEVQLIRKNRVLVVASKGTYGFADEPFPEFAHDKEVVISNRATGLNPIDYKSVDYNFCLPEFPWVTGREMAGVVEEVGSGVTDVKVGDHVWTSTYYRDRRAGCFQHYVTVPAHTVLPLPSNLSFDHAACLGVAGLTASMTLWRWLEVPMTPQSSSSEAEYLLLWGGSAVTGQFAIQIATRCGLKVIAVTSSKTQTLAQSLGAHHVVIRDGKTEAEIVAEIRSIAGDNITKAIDLVGTKTANFCMEAMSTSKQGIFAPLAMISSKAVIPANIRVETVEMKQFVLNEESRIYALELNRLVETGTIKLPDIHVLEGGLDVVIGGLERLKGGDMAGKKMVVRMV
ncbi:GroES-like protein [Hyaloscypha variabilis F]|uniref:GroES-like protein n=1 Tax=Hyaloscypha variabilis (strain UAMH 11265 / GT02V1 / F) TaxID=1149755 RepID=A0A2J6SBV9_HYAVF|nr:GroES-like protein [Hyaloscypha variabilis F]